MSSTPASTPVLHDSGHGSHARGDMLKLSLGALGVVYGDIGTSPLYAIKESLHAIHGGDTKSPIPPEQALGVASLAFWLLLIVVVLKYLTIVMRADNRGEGGILSMLALLLGQESGDNVGVAAGDSRRTNRRGIVWLALFAAALLLADGVITPAISVLSAVEGLEVTAPQLHAFVVPITVAILFGLFWVQKYGTESIGRWYGPIMLVWFVCLAIFGLLSIVHEPSVLRAVSPHYIFQLAIHDPWHTFTLLGSVVLVITGAEALYADMGHFGRGPIRFSWYTLVFPALMLNYFGQTAAVLADSHAAENPFWAAVPQFMRYPMVVIATIATIIASQAMISGAFSLSRQAMQLGYSPRLRVVHTSAYMMGQIFVPTVNTFMMFCYIGLVLVFQESSRLAALYGLAVTATFLITSTLLLVVALRRWQWPTGRALLLVGVFIVVDLFLVASNTLKLDDGGWVTLLMASLVFTGMLIWHVGRRIVASSVYQAFPLSSFLASIRRDPPHRVKGTAIFMTTRPGIVPAVLLHHLRHNRVLHDRVILLSVRTLPLPTVAEENRFKHHLSSEGFEEATLSFGFMEEPNVPETLRRIRDTSEFNIDLEGVSYYLGHVSLRITDAGRMPRLIKTIFGFMYHNERPAHEFFKLPVNRVIELGRQAEI